jgi:hypothetical protein
MFREVNPSAGLREEGVGSSTSFPIYLHIVSTRLLLKDLEKALFAG